MKAIIQGVYFLYDGNECVYIGSSSDIWRRIPEHLRGVGHTVKKQFDSFEVFEVEDESKMIWLEYRLIQLLKPKYNNTKDLWGKNVPKTKVEINTNKDHSEYVAHYVLDSESYRNSICVQDVDSLLGLPHGTTYKWSIDGTIPHEYVVSDIPGAPIIRRRIKTEYVDRMFVALKLKGE